MRLEIELIQAREAQLEAEKRMSKVKSNIQAAGYRESDFQHNSHDQQNLAEIDSFYDDGEEDKEEESEAIEEEK